MNILMIHPHDLFDKSEPWTIRIKAIAKELVKKGHIVKICYFPLKINQTVHIRSIDSIEIIPFSRAPSPKAFLINTVRLIRRCRWADIVHFQKCHHYASVPTVLAAYITKRPLHYDWDDWEEKIWFESCGFNPHSILIGCSFRVIEHFLPRLVSTVSVASDRLGKLAQEFGVEQNRIFPAPVGADLERFNPENDGSRIRKKYNITTPLILYVGQLHGAQYVDLYIRAANIVLQREPNVTFMIVGEGFLEIQLRRFVKDLGIEDKVIFTGAVPHEEVPFYVAAADVCVASFRETKVTRCKSPLKIAEYLASGKAIVASNVGEVRKMLGGAGILVGHSNEQKLAEGIVQLLRSKELRESLGTAARIRALTKYNWEYTARSILSAYETAFGE